MSSEIKFRAWDKIEKKYIYWDEIVGYCDFSWILSKTDAHAGFGTGRFVAEQFTGLHDKNGVEIYENDVVSDGKYHGIIEFWDCYFVVNWEISCPHDNDLNYWNDKIKVIGNIHESEETSCN